LGLDGDIKGAASGDGGLEGEWAAGSDGKIVGAVILKNETGSA